MRKNYIHQLQAELTEAEARLFDIQECLGHIRSYLQSDKFHIDTTVQAQDVLSRLESIRDCLVDFEPRFDK